MPNLGPDYSLAVRLARLEDRLDRLAANPLGQNFSATQSDGSVGLQITQDPTTGSTAMILRQGANTPRDPDTAQHAPLMYAGEVIENGVPQDSTVIFFGPNGTRMVLGGSQGLAVLDDQLNTVISIDSASGEGLADPWLPLPIPQPTGVASWPKTAVTSWGTVAENEFRAQHPKVWWVAQAYADAGTNGDARIVIIDGTGATVATGATWPVTGGAFATIGDTLTLPAGFFSQGYQAEVQLQVTSGSGNVYCQTFSLYGRQS